MRYPIITISREYGSGGRSIGRKLADELQIPFYDKEIIALTAQKSGFSEEVIAQAEQNKPQSFLYGLYMTSQALPVNDQVFIVQTRLIREISEKGPCVIVGRCANYVLREHKDCLHVFIHAPVEDRVRRATEVYGVREKNPESLVRREDKRRAAYYSHFTQEKWGHAQSYHMAINSSIGEERVVRLIQLLAKGDTQ